MAKKLYEDRFKWSAVACENDVAGQEARIELLHYYEELLLCDIKIDELLDGEVSANEISSAFTRHRHELVEWSDDIRMLQNRIPFMPVIHDRFWTGKRILKLLTLLEYKDECCYPLIHQKISEGIFRNRVPLDDIHDSVYFFFDICTRRGKHMSPMTFEKAEYKKSMQSYLLSLPELILLLIAHPSLLEESYYMAGSSGNITTGYPVIYFMENKKLNVTAFECRNMDPPVSAAIPLAYSVIYGDE